MYVRIRTESSKYDKDEDNLEFKMALASKKNLHVLHNSTTVVVFFFGLRPIQSS